MSDEADYQNLANFHAEENAGYAPGGSTRNSRRCEVSYRLQTETAWAERRTI
jgi:hypothetical protein